MAIIIKFMLLLKKRLLKTMEKKKVLPYGMNILKKESIKVLYNGIVINMEKKKETNYIKKNANLILEDVRYNGIVINMEKKKEFINIMKIGKYNLNVEDWKNI